jgi:hypothetical protein
VIILCGFVPLWLLIDLLLQGRVNCRRMEQRLDFKRSQGSIFSGRTFCCFGFKYS